jgi:hypothetical protein
VRQVPVAGEATQRVKILNANWVPDPDGGDGRFELMIVTEDDERHAVSASPASVSAIVALSRADTVLAWDPVNRTLIVANILGTPCSPPSTARARRSGPRPLAELIPISSDAT